jgi:two-component system sensor histidine kinase YesM
MTGKTRSIIRTFTRLFIASLVTFSLLLLLSVIWFTLSAKEASREYLDSNLTKISQSLNEYFYNIEKIGFGISSNWSFANLYNAAANSDKSSYVENAYQISNFICSYNTGITDIMVVDTNGIARSYFAGINYNIIKDIPEQTIFLDSSNLERSFFFFAEDSVWNEDYFVYCVPIFSVENSLTALRKVATGVLLCNKKQLKQILGYDQSLASEYYTLYYADQYITSNLKDRDTFAIPGNALKNSLPLTYDKLSVTGVHIPHYLKNNLSSLLIFGTALLFLLIAMLLLVAYHVRICITRPIGQVKMQLYNFNSGDLNKRIDLTNIDEIDEIIIDMNHMIEEIKTITKKIFITQDTLYETELRKKEAELYALQSQINPHFLYNTLQCISGLAALKRFQDINEVALSMSEVFKYSIKPGEFVTCVEEIRIIYKYLSIYKIRFNGNLDYEIDVADDILDCPMVKMIIQPTVENAMVHGFVDTDKKPMIHIIGRIQDGNILFRIIDNGMGISHEKLSVIKKLLERSFSDSIKDQTSFGLGLYNINRRIRLVYGDNYGISLFSNPNGTEVDILIPMELPTNNSTSAVLV